MAVNDHGLEVLKKSGEQVTPGDGTDLLIKVSDKSNPFAAPREADAFTRECLGNDVIYKFRQGGLTGTVLKTLTLKFQTPQDPDLTGGLL